MLNFILFLFQTLIVMVPSYNDFPILGLHNNIVFQKQDKLIRCDEDA